VATKSRRRRAALLTLALPVLIWRLARRVGRQRRATREDLIEGIW
jgi:hypothetical protein